MDFKKILFGNKRTNFVIKIGMATLLILIICLLIFRACSNNNDKSNSDDTYGEYEITDGREKRETSEKAKNDSGYIKFAGYGKYEVSEENPNIELSNPASNFADFVFTVRDSESQKLIGKTEKVPPGKYVYMNVVNFFKTPGVYSVDINISTFDSVTETQLNGVNQKMEITIR